ncbi:hypothetical protein Pmar_PMAR010226 [Perkinsus marinus ATCC 50983]|uniref:Uncharacterized protein n=1 Tax=Perkinsus marinus (strain ATCC 50983 / TXsc) TaxID=423536 RepID=C5K563_PERM5|nr:hypothetical protein Pmar_PMAR010226 [Perkinsus marinus ATCC 50983]EER20485.1 hypothetical protein Pmar_PMAR010226 [Perkinsus marinus ATCC 50983]|eukprot:XP_002788689.1 hypothetical protein Pmar_PMAR010226 [Perkinsus marinus ATCC 50983]
MMGLPASAPIALPIQRGLVPIGFAPPTKWRMRPTSTKLAILYLLYTFTITCVLTFIMWLAYVKIPYIVDIECDREGHVRTPPAVSTLTVCEQINVAHGGPAKAVSVVTCRCHPRRDISVV